LKTSIHRESFTSLFSLEILDILDKRTRNTLHTYWKSTSI